jgi:hypothetical protein
MSKVIKDSIEIEHNKEKIWAILLDDATYRVWAEAFCEGSYFEGNVEVGNDVFFLDLEGTGLKCKVKEYETAKKVSYEGVCAIVDDEEAPQEPETKKWKGLQETWSVSSQGKKTTLTIQAEVPDEYYESMTKMWKKALKSIKELCEEDNAGVPDFF